MLQNYVKRVRTFCFSLSIIKFSRRSAGLLGRRVIKRRRQRHPEEWPCRRSHRCVQIE